MDSTLMTYGVTLTLLTLSSGYFSGSETALFSLSSTKVKMYATDANPRRSLIAKLLRKPRDLLVTVFMLNTLVNILLQNVSSGMFGDQAGWDLKVGVPLLLTLIFGEIIPKNIGLDRNIPVAYLVAPSINFFQKLLGPLRRLTVAITAPISRALFFFLRRDEEISQEELIHVLKTSQEHGVLVPDEAELVGGYLRLQDVTVKELMQPKEDILFYAMKEPLTQLVHLFTDEECSRIPVCQHSLDDLLGVMSAKQFFLNQERIQTPKDLKLFISKPLFAPESMPARKLLRRFDETGEVISLVVDEYGSIVGLVTKEDLAEVVIGEVSDLRDQKGLYTRSGRYEIIASGKMELNDFNELFDVDLKSNTMLTIGGWLTEQMGDIPKPGSKFETDQFLFQVLAATPTRLRRLYIRKLPTSGDL